jgi:bile acid:Na+ symporter, BASS family
MTAFSAFSQQVASLAVAVFVISSMLNVGLTQRPSRISKHLANWHYLVRMVLVNLIVVPALIVFALDVVPLEPVYAAGLLLFGTCAGAPFLIKLTSVSDNDMALGATVLMVLMAATVVIVPVLLPLLLKEISVDAGAIAVSLLRQLIIPMVIGMLLTQFLEGVAGAIQPWVAKLSSLALYATLVATFLGYLHAMIDPALWKAVVLGTAVLALAFLVGYMMGDGQAHLKDVGGLSTAQRGTAAAMIVAASNFTDPRIFIIVNVINAVGIVLLIAVAKGMNRRNRVAVLEPVVADPPGRGRTADQTRGRRRPRRRKR